MRYELRQEDIESFVQSTGIRTREHGDEIEFERCPYCNGGRDDKWTFALNREKGTFNCFRSSCGKSGHFVELCRDFDYDLQIAQVRLVKSCKLTKRIESKPAAVKYLESRGISQKITEQYEVTTKKDQDNILSFPLIDENNVLRGIKYRDTAFQKGQKGNKEFFEKGWAPYLFGVKQATEYEKPLVITEGQIDSLSLAEAGIPNAVSVPNGCRGFTWVPLCKQWMAKFPEIIVMGDYENGKITLFDELRSMLPNLKFKVVRKIDYLGEKDANDILRTFGPHSLVKAIENAEYPKSRRIIDISEVKSINNDDVPRIPTGVPALDKALGGGLAVGSLVLLTGKRGEGKSTFGSQMICSALEHGETVFAYSGELENAWFKSWLIHQLAGMKNIEKIDVDEKGHILPYTKYHITEESSAKIDAWLKGRAFMYDNAIFIDEDEEQESVINTIRNVIETRSPRFLFVDNLMSAMEVSSNGDNLYSDQSKFVGKLKKMAMLYQCVIVLVAHQRKSNANDKDNGFDNDAVMGSGDITNKVDVILQYGRLENPTVDQNGKRVTAKLALTKNRTFNGILRTYTKKEDKRIGMDYEEGSMRVAQSGIPFFFRYSWEKIDLDNRQEVTADDLFDMM